MNEAEQEREKLVTDLANYVAAMAPHQKERMGGLLILRAFAMLKRLRVPSCSPEEHKEKLLDNGANEVHY